MAESSSLTGTIVVGVVLALAVGSSSPWWWEKVFPPKSVHTEPAPPPPAAPYMGELQYNTNLQGSDFVNIQRADVNTEGACSEKCLKNDRCKAMTFVRTQSGGVCWLKDKVPASLYNAAMISAVKVYPPN